MGVRQEFLRLLKEDEEFRYAVAGLIGLREVLERLDRHEEQLVKLREDMNRLREDMNKLREDMVKGFERVERHIVALGARWGVYSEEAFRSALRGILEEEFGAKVERWTTYDEKGLVYGYPSKVEVDVVVSDGKLILIEVTSHARASDVSELKKKAELYYEKEGVKPDRLIIVTPYADEKARKACLKLAVELYTRA